MAAYNSKMTLKLLIDAGSNKILFAEAEKDFIDFMFSLLLLPLGSVIKLVAPQTTLGSIGKLYQSVENMNGTYLVPNLNKSTLLQPTVSALVGASPLHLTGTIATPKPKKTGYCEYCQRQVNISDCNTCPDCGFVKEVVTYMITDDLEVTPMPAISSITLINRFSLKKDVRLEEKAVIIGMKEGLALLEASLKSVTTLTDVFLNSSIKNAASSV
ncbi:hypothetical protein KSP39_PZI003788 [Platanthera zijinensis]|uniref:Uncharacterized protein n=1 Tax=Platanthera zijinensis TaxID=2320716 RepID=A0AAP0BW04_9ASPA